MNNTNISIRLEEEQKNYLEQLANLNDTSISKLVRIAITNLFINHKNDYNKIDKDQESELNPYISISFLKLINWLYEKRINPKVEEEHIFYKEMYDFVETLIYDDNTPNDLKTEFLKVKENLEFYFINVNEMWAFDFDDPNEEWGLDYEVISKFISELDTSDKINTISI